MEVLVKVGQLLLSLSILIVLHELGHFAPAKWFKTRVDKFYLFFDAAPFNSLFKITRGGTEYGIGWLPLGGYVKIAGMVDESMDTEALKGEPQPWEFRSKKAWQRLIIMLGGVTVNFILGILIFGLMAWHWGKTYIPNTELKYGIQMDSILINQGFQHGDILTKIGDRNLDRLNPMAFVEEVVLNNATTAIVQRNGKSETITLPNNFAQTLTSGQVQKKMLMMPRHPFEVRDFAKGSPAEHSGLKKEDKIIGVNGISSPYFGDFAVKAAKFADKPIELTVLRGIDTIKINLTLTSDGKMGVYPNTEKFFTVSREKVAFAGMIPSGWNDAMDFLGMQMKAFGQMFKGKIKVQDNLGSLISIGNMFPGTWDWESFWHLTASLSILLAFMNLLPIPALDGGYVMFLIWEVVTGRRVSDSFMEKAVTVGFMLLMGLMVLAFGLDIWRNFIK
jgi:regulator of sigma E protease